MARQRSANAHDRADTPSWSLDIEKLKITANSPSTISFTASLVDPSRSRVLRRERRAVERCAPGSLEDADKEPSRRDVARLRKMSRKLEGHRPESTGDEDRGRAHQRMNFPAGRRSYAGGQEGDGERDSGVLEYQSDLEYDGAGAVQEATSSTRDPVKKSRGGLTLREAYAAGCEALASTGSILPSVDFLKLDYKRKNAQRDRAAEISFQRSAPVETPIQSVLPSKPAPESLSVDTPHPPRRRRNSIATPTQPLSRANSTSRNGNGSRHRRRSTSVSLDHVQRMTPEDYLRAEQKRIDRLAPPKIGEPLGPYILRMLDPSHPTHIPSLNLTEEDCISRWYRLEGSLRPDVAETKRDYVWRMCTLHASRARDERMLYGVEMPIVGEEMQRELDEVRWEVVEGSTRPFVGETREEYRKRMVRPWLLEDGHAVPTAEVIAAKLAAKMRWEVYCGRT
ncbi:hypothetical protein Tdes44962_MAKER04980 [Teratosphaeria destructans]|uniref:Uncharacterized protein n=1 Tax=Teratosphaeria destructans TaxID=418781 RepID=A0A9W7SLP5_9PEZI|nr:hypothetical protein Tdes44962_MAKER04980 [Teratosphaeria destructans]